MGFITLHNSLLRTRVPVGLARAGRSDLGSMHPIGTRIVLDGVTTADYAANSKAPQRFLRKVVESLANIGANCFPDVLAVMQDIEGYTGLQPVATMADRGSEHRVAYSVDMSVDLGNASHYNVGMCCRAFWFRLKKPLAWRKTCDAKCMWHDQWNPIQWCCCRAIPWFIQ